MLQRIYSGQESRRGSLSKSHSPFIASDNANDGRFHLLLAASGSVATIKIPNILDALAKHDSLAIRLILTSSATNFLAGQSTEQPQVETLRSYKNVDGIYLDAEEWAQPWKRGQPILHIELRRWAHMLVIAPLSANTLAKIVGGFSDNLLTSVVRAWDTTGETEDGLVRHPGRSPFSGQKRIVVAPAMNTAMWRHPITKRHIAVLHEEWGIGNREGVEKDGWFEVLMPVEKELACGDVGDGAMKDWNEIVEVIQQRFGLL